MQQISQAEVEDRLRFDNPWWAEGAIEERFARLPRRAYFRQFYALLSKKQLNRAPLLMGPRRVGKTVLVYHAIAALLADSVPAQNILYISLETPVYTGLSLAKLLTVFTQVHQHRRHYALYIFFDEIQYHKDWEVHLKSLVDSFPAYRFVATGSAAAALRLKSQESGAGRFTDFLLPPLSFAEYLEFIGKREELIVPAGENERGQTLFTTPSIEALNQYFVNYLNYGGYPEAVFSDAVREDPGRFVKNDIIDKVLLRDLPSLYGIDDTQELNKLFAMLAFNTGREISYEELSQSANIAKNTIKRYIEYLDAAFLIKCVHRLDQSAKTFRRATSFKVYLTNPSMRAALFGPIKEDSEAMGALTETAIFAQCFHSLGSQNLFYARWKRGEVDIVHLSEGRLKPDWCVEVKWSDLPHKDHRKLAALVDFIEKHPLEEKPLITTKTIADKQMLVKGHAVEFIPSALYAYHLGINNTQNRP